MLRIGGLARRKPLSTTIWRGKICHGSAWRMSLPEVIDAEFEEIPPTRLPPEPRWSDHVLAVVFWVVGVPVGIGLALGALDFLGEHVDWPLVGLLIGGFLALGLAVAWWRLVLALIALGAALVILASFGLLVPLLAILAVLALLGVVAWGVISTIGRI